MTASRILLGMTSDLNGAGQTPYGAVTDAVLAYFRKLDAEDGGVCGRKVVVLPEDDQYAPQLALERTRKLVEEDGVLAMFGAFSTEGHRDVAAYLNDPNADGDKQDGVPDLFLSTGWSGWGDTGAYPWTIGYIPDYVADGAVLGRYIAAAIADAKVGVLYEDDAFGREYLAGVEEALRGGPAIVAREASPPDATDVSAQLGRVKDAGATVVVLAAAPEVTAGVIRQAESLQFAPRWFVSYTNAASSLASELGGGRSAEQLLDGFRRLARTISTAYLLSAIEDETAPQMLEHQRIMQTYDGPPVSSLSVYGQSLAEVVTEALSRSCDNLTRPGLLAAAESITGFQSSLMLPGVEVDLGDGDHRAIEALQPVEIRAGGEVVPVGDVISAADILRPAAPSPTPTLTP